MRRLSCMLIAVAALAGCGPNEQRRAELAEEKRIACLDKICDGDVQPKRDETKDAIWKVNGQWYVGPKEYFTPSGPRGFNWWQHKPLDKVSPRPPELEALIADGKGYDISVEIFFTGRQRWPNPNVQKPWETFTWAKEVERLQAEGLRMQQTAISPELDVIRFNYADGRAYRGVYYVATKEKRIRGDEPPVLACTISEPPRSDDRCKAGEDWQPDVYADFRLRAKHANDWPSIHQEIIRVLNLAKKVQP